MELVVRKTDLLRELQLFQGIVERKNTIPILANVLIEAAGDEVKLLATDLEVGLRSRCAAAVSKGNDAWAARILGAREAMIERTGNTLVDMPVRDVGEQPERQARARLSPERWDHAYAAGRQASDSRAAQGHRSRAGQPMSGRLSRFIVTPSEWTPARLTLFRVRD